MELQNFISSLDRQADWPETGETLLHRIVTKKINKTTQPSQHVFPTEDLILLDNAEDLKILLGKKFQKPLLCRSVLRDNVVSLDDFWDYLRSQLEKEIDVYDYSVVKPEKRTQKMRVAEVIRHWQIPS